ncbi:MAG: hypothetical protein P1P73_09940 [Brevefilum sp.]|nr:hypothetical protein [Brevefilum sp.]MDW7754817.1 hypothetical protein [Brevefilum sp.]
MFKKTSKSLVFMGALLVFSLLLASCQSMLVSTEEMERNQAVENWETYFEEMEQANVPPEELRSDVSSESEVIVDAYSPRIEIGRTWLDAKTYKAS